MKKVLSITIIVLIALGALGLLFRDELRGAMFQMMLQPDSEFAETAAERHRIIHSQSIGPHLSVAGTQCWRADRSADA